MSQPHTFLPLSSVAIQKSRVAIKFERGKWTGYGGIEDECTGYNGTQCTDWLWNSLVALTQKQMSPKAGSLIIKVSVDEVIRRLFVEMPHCDWIIDPLRLLVEMSLCECPASSCVTSEITTSAVRVRALAALLTVHGRDPGGRFCGWRHHGRLCLCRRARRDGRYTEQITA